MNLDTFLEIDNPVECWNKLHDSLVTIANEIIPKKEYRVQGEKPAWLTDELLNLYKEMSKRQKHSGDEGDWFVARNVRKRVNIAIRSAKAKYIKDQVEFHRKDPKNVWNLIQSEILPENKAKIFNFKNEENGQVSIRMNRTNVLGVRSHNDFELRDFVIEELQKCIKEITLY